VANDLSVLAPKLLAQGLVALRSANLMPLLVNSDYSMEFATKGLVVTIPVSSAVAAQDVTPANTPPSTADVAPTSALITLDQWKEAPFYLTDKDQQQASDGVIPMQASEAVKSLSDAVNAYILSKYKGIYGFYGTPGTTPFASTTTAATQARKILNKQLAPMNDRRFIMDPDAEANALDLRAFQDASWAMTADAIQEGTITRRLGFDWFMDQQIPSHTAGTITTGLIAKASTAQAIGLKAIVCTTAASSGACALVVGDIITFAGQTQTYVVTAAATQASASTDVTVNVEPGLKVALAGSEAVSVKSTHVCNLALHRDAIGFASRPLADSGQGLGNIIEVAVDPITGLALRLEISREHKRTRFSYDILYGATLVRPDLAARVAG
jgi:hypothetical protein